MDFLSQDAEYKEQSRKTAVNMIILPVSLSFLATMVFSSFHGLKPKYLRAQFINCCDITDYSLRDSVNKLAVPFPCTNFLKNN